MANLQCWEVIQCGKESTCPAYPDHGRKCWEVANTLCRGERQGSYDDKIGGCREVCEFYKKLIHGK